MPSASVVCYDEVMEGLVTNACLVRGGRERLFLWVLLSLLLSCLPFVFDDAVVVIV